jgi:hypothetical protein
MPSRVPALPPSCSLALALLALALPAGCGPGEDALAADADVVEVQARSDLRIGALEGEGADVFGRITGLAVAEDGRVVVLDEQASELRVFGPDGGHRFTFGRRGAGPGELGQACCTAFGPDGLLWVRDGGNARYSAYRLGTAGAEHVRTVRMHHGDVNRWAPLTFDADGRLIDIGARVDAPGAAPAVFRLHIEGDSVALQQRAPEALAGAVPTHTVQRAMEGGSATLFFYQPFGPSHLTAHGPEGVHADAVSSSYEIRVYASDGTLVRTITRAMAGPELSAAERTRAAERMESDARRANVPVGDLPFTIPSRKPPIRHLAFDTAGNLWVFLEPADGAPRTAHVYGGDGTLLRAVHWTEPLASTPLVLHADALHGVVRDSLDVQYVVRLRTSESPLSGGGPIPAH